MYGLQGGWKLKCYKPKSKADGGGDETCMQVNSITNMHAGDNVLVTRAHTCSLLMLQWAKCWFLPTHGCISSMQQLQTLHPGTPQCKSLQKQSTLQQQQATGNSSAARDLFVYTMHASRVNNVSNHLWHNCKPENNRLQTGRVGTGSGRAFNANEYRLHINCSHAMLVYYSQLFISNHVSTP